MLVASCGEPVPVDCTPDEEQCTTETEGGFETGTVAGIAAGGAAVLALAAGGLSSDDGGSGSSSSVDGGSSNSGPVLTGTLIDSLVSGVSYQSTSNLSGITSSNGRFSYRSGDQVTFQIGDTILGTVTGGAVITPVELAGVSNTADRRVINIARLLQSLDEDQDPSNGVSINATTRAAMLGRNLSFDVPISSFSANENIVLAVAGKGLVASNDAINHLHGSLVEEGRLGSIATETAIKQLVPSFVAKTTGQSCDFAGGTVPDGGNVVAYQSESVEAGSTCSSQTRFCNNGQLSGSYTYTTCQAEEATDCQFNGNSIANGVSTTAYQTATVPFGSACTSQTRTCSNGTLSGSYTFSKCDEADPVNCFFNGTTIQHGYFVTAYLSDSVAAGSSCSSQNRTCFNGVLSGTYAHGYCAIQQALSCSFNDQPIDSGQSITAYLSNSVPFGSDCISETRSCDNGFLSGSYAFGSCTVAAAASCNFNGQTIQSGSSVTAYQAASVSYGNNCVSQNRTCNNGFLSGSYNHSSCEKTGRAEEISVGGRYHTCSRLNSGHIKCWGNNSWGQLGNGGKTNSAVPVLVEGINEAVEISAGQEHNCALMTDRTIKCWGFNGYGGLGDGNPTNSRTLPVSVLGINNAMTISAGGGFTCAVLLDGTVRCWGTNLFGQLGNGNYGGTWNEFDEGIDSSIPVEVLGLSNVISVDAGYSHACALLNNGTVKCWGRNYSGQLGDGNQGGDFYSYTPGIDTSEPIPLASLSNVRSISAGGSATCAVLNNNSGMCWGSQSGTISSSTLEGLYDVKNISAGFNHSCLLSITDAVKCWGWGGLGALGDGNSIRYTNTLVNVYGLSGVSGISVSDDLSCGILNDGTVKCWGTNDNGQLGNGTSGGDRYEYDVGIDSLIPVKVTGL
tara:strand:+ start:1711 stop:4413 length:2703 start_codon:yes stop_codon:yes gene_type:complete